MDAPKRCKDCRHYLVEIAKTAVDACNHPELATYNSIGDRDITWASYARKGECGPEAKFFEAKDMRDRVKSRVFQEV